jgi:cytochrome oxidase Cu insertion factor (SCO1/SenC/PrrC family)
MLPEVAVTPDTSEEQVAALVDAVKQDPRRRDRLVALLPEQIPLYAGRSTNATVRMRGYVIAAFGQVGLPAAALPYVLEELESGRDAYLVAAAARALRGLDGHAGQVVPFLLKAIENVRYADDAVSFDSYRPRWPLPSHTTATEEIMKTFAWLGPDAGSARPALEALREDPQAMSTSARATLDAVLARLGDAAAGCCVAPVSWTEQRAGTTRRDLTVPADVELEDQDGRRLSFGGFFSGRPSIVAFFYTRCDNPNKCSLTITKLAALQRALQEQGLRDQVRTAAVTYDPAYDLPPRLRAYGENRGVVFGDNHRLLRTTAGLEALQQYFDLGVNFGQASVNRHRIELFILDHEAAVAAKFTRLQWAVDQVLRHACALVSLDDASARGAHRCDC